MRELIIKFKKDCRICSYDISILYYYVNIDNFCNYIKCIGCDVNYSDNILFDPHLIPKSMRYVHTYIEIILSTNSNIIPEYDHLY